MKRVNAYSTMLRRHFVAQQATNTLKIYAPFYFWPSASTSGPSRDMAVTQYETRQRDQHVDVLTHGTHFFQFSNRNRISVRMQTFELVEFSRSCDTAAPVT